MARCVVLYSCLSKVLRPCTCDGVVIEYPATGFALLFGLLYCRGDNASESYPGVDGWEPAGPGNLATILLSGGGENGSYTFPPTDNGLIHAPPYYVQYTDYIVPLSVFGHDDLHCRRSPMPHMEQVT